MSAEKAVTFHVTGDVKCLPLLWVLKIFSIWFGFQQLDYDEPKQSFLFPFSCLASAELPEPVHVHLSACLGNFVSSPNLLRPILWDPKHRWDRPAASVPTRSCSPTRSSLFFHHFCPTSFQYVVSSYPSS